MLLLIPRDSWKLTRSLALMLQSQEAKMPLLVKKRNFSGGGESVRCFPAGS